MAGKKLLVADDSLTIQKVIRLALSNEGYEIQAVSDGNDAVQQISLFRPDVVLIDVSLPGKSAFEVKRAINGDSDLEDVRFVLMSSAFEKVDEVQVNEVQFHGRLTKPFDPAHLREVLSQVLAQIHAKRTEKTMLNLTPPPIPQQEYGIPSRPTFEEPSFGLGTPAMNAPAPGFGGTASAFGATPAFGASVDDNAEQLAPDADIKQLTESTIRMSGLDDFEWSVQEPSLKPPSNMLNMGSSESDPEVNFPLSSKPLHAPSEVDASSAYHHAPEDFSLESHRHSHGPGHSSGPGHGHGPAIPPPIPAAHSPHASTAHSVSSDEVQRMVAQQVEEALSRMARQMLPEIAEKLIKAEIHKLLNEQH